MIYRKANWKDFKVLASIHHLAFKDFFLTSLGKGFLELYYKACLKSNGSIAICAVNEQNTVIGFASGSLHAKGYHKKIILSNLTSFIYSGLVIALTNPASIIRLIKNIDKTPSPEDDRNYSELLSIAVLPELRGSGTANELLKMFEKEVANRGGNRIALTTDYNNNDRVLAFYKKNSYHIYYEFITYPKRKMYKMVKIIESEIT